MVSIKQISLAIPKSAILTILSFPLVPPFRQFLHAISWKDKDGYKYPQKVMTCQLTLLTWQNSPITNWVFLCDLRNKIYCTYSLYTGVSTNNIFRKEDNGFSASVGKSIDPRIESKQKESNSMPSLATI
uniref:Uncharacterized protein n=1 Tax=Strongyloides venezuelensis TaxID=75913 RepID=A0A0K0G5V7_STRVS